MTDPTPAPSEDHPGFESALRAGAVPEAELAAAIRARPASPGRAGMGTGTGPVRWVRAADAAAELSSTTAGRGIDLHRELARRIRSAPTALQPAVADRIRAITPVLRAALPTRSGGQLGRTR